MTINNGLARLICDNCGCVTGFEYRGPADGYRCSHCDWRHDQDLRPVKRTGVVSTFHKLPTVCFGLGLNDCRNQVTRIRQIGNQLWGYCDSCMLDLVLTCETVKVTR